MKVIVCLVVCAATIVTGALTPKLRVRPKQSAPPKSPAQMLTLPSNATSIRAEITDTFSCENRTYGYYADVDNDCQIFHVCLPVTYADGKERTFRWSFICPEETQFNQENFTCARAEESIDCEESEEFYALNDNFGQTTTDEEEDGRNATERNQPDSPNRGVSLKPDIRRTNSG